MTIPAEITYGTIPQILEDEETLGRHGELDALTIKILADYPGWQESAQELGFVKLQKLSGYHAMFVEDMARGPRSATVCEVTVNCLGLIASGERRRRTLGVSGQQIAVGPYEKVIIAISTEEQGEDPAEGGGTVEVKRRVPKLDEYGEVQYETIVTPSGSAERWNVRQPIVNVTDTWFSTTPPDMSIVGTAQTPPNAPTVPVFVWGSYDKPTRANHPNGWVLDDRQVEEIFPAGTTGGLWAVTDTYGHYATLVPD